jgi:hypothetical protein
LITHHVVVSPSEGFGVAKPNVLESAFLKESYLGLAAKESNAVCDAAAAHALDIRLQGRSTEAQALELGTDGNRVEADCPAVRSVANRLARVSLSAMKDLLPVLGTIHIFVRHHRVTPQSRDDVDEHEPPDIFRAIRDVPTSHFGCHPPVLPLGHVTDVEETIAEISREPDTILGLSSVSLSNRESVFFNIGQARVKERKEEKVRGETDQ